ncbi:MAG: PAS domain S-box protein [Planctomycetes bacterium]|nr:PAS domain S-box protein [Planctomycetota bacterium]
MTLRATLAGVAATAILVTFSLLSWKALQAQQDDLVDRTTESVLALIRSAVEHRLSGVDRALDRLAEAAMAGDRGRWEDDARAVLAAAPGLRSVAWLESDGEIIDSVDSTEFAQTRDSDGEPTPGGMKWSVAEAGQGERDLPDGRRLRFWVGLPSLLAGEAARAVEALGYSARIRSPAASTSESRWSRSMAIRVPFPFELSVEPTSTTVASLRTPLPTALSVALLALSFLGGAGVFLCSLMRDRTRDLARANEQLQGFNRQLDERVTERTEQVERSRAAAMNIARDAREQAELLKISEERLRSVLESAADAILLVDADHRILSANPATERLFQQGPESLLDRRIDELMPEIPMFATLEAKSSESRALLLDARVDGVRADGSTVRLSLSITRASNGHFTVVARDLTHWIEAEARFERVVESAPSAMLMSNDQGEIVLVNSEAERLFGYTREELVGRRVEVLVPPRFRPEHPASRAAYFASPVTRQMGKGGGELYAVRKDGTEFPVEIGLNPMRTDAGLMALSVIVDVTERKDSERELRRYAKELEERNHDLDSFAHAVSHDLKAPLRGITSIAQWTLEDYADKIDEEGRDNLQIMAQRCDRLGRLIDGILAYSRLGRTERVPIELPTRDIVRNIVESLEIPDGIQVFVDPDLPNVIFDETQFEQLVQNLVSNAVKYMGKPNGRVSITFEDRDERWLFAVRDTGIGIEPRHFERIFEVFRTLQPRDEIESTGVGLSLVRRIVLQHGGEVWVESEVGEGSTFYFTVLKEPLPPEPAPGSPAASREKGARDWDSGRGENGDTATVDRHGMSGATRGRSRAVETLEE